MGHECAGKEECGEVRVGEEKIPSKETSFSVASKCFAFRSGSRFDLVIRVWGPAEDAKREAKQHLSSITSTAAFLHHLSHFHPTLNASVRLRSLFCAAFLCCTIDVANYIKNPNAYYIYVEIVTHAAPHPLHGTHDIETPCLIRSLYTAYS